jgi:hypothetical protein
VYFTDSIAEIMDDDEEDEPQGQTEASDMKTPEAESAPLDTVAQEHSQHPSPVSTS